MAKITAGYYLPGVMRIRIETNKSLNKLAEIDQDIQGAWFHEHIHYLQDVTTVSGAYAMVKLLDRTRRSLESIQKESNPVQIPLQGVIGNELHQIEIFFSVQEGDFELHSSMPLISGKSFNLDELKITDVTFHDEPRIATLFPPDQGQKVRLHLQDLKKRVTQYEFGSLAIREQIAHYMDRKFYKIPQGAKFPYQICEDVANFYCYGFSDQPRLLCCLCEVALSYPLPGWAFCKLLEAMKSEQFDFKNAEINDILAFSYRKFVELGWDPAVEATYLIAETQKLTSNLFQAKEFSDTVEWFQHIITEGLSLRQQFPALLTDVFIEKKAFSQSHGVLITRLGSPMSLNFSAELGMIVPSVFDKSEKKIFPQSLLVVQQLLVFFTTGNVPCKLPQSQGKSPCDCITLTDDENIAMRCQGKPWANLQPPMCPFSGFWRLYNLDKVRFVDKKGHSL